MQDNIGLRIDLQMNIRDLTGLGAPWVGNNDLYVRIILFMGLQPSVKYRMTPGGIRAGNEKTIRQFYVIITDRNSIFTQCSFVA